MQQLKFSRSITDRNSLSTEKYLAEISKISMQSADEEAELRLKARNGDRYAHDKLVTANLRFVVSVAKQYPNHFLSLNDLVNEGNIGLIMAAKRFDETKGFKFISYAVWWIRQSIIRAIMEDSKAVRMPIKKTQQYSQLKRTADLLEQQLEREPTHAELCGKVKMNEKQVAETMMSIPVHIALDATFGDGDEMSLHDVLEDDEARKAYEENTGADSIKIEVERMLSVLSKKERRVLEMYFGFSSIDPQRLDKIGEEMGLSKQRVGHIKQRALYKLRVRKAHSWLRGYQ